MNTQECEIDLPSVESNLLSKDELDAVSGEIWFTSRSHIDYKDLNKGLVAIPRRPDSLREVAVNPRAGSDAPFRRCTRNDENPD